jgi:hypothetical protein
MERLPLNPYDFFGYLASGLLLIIGMDLVFGFPHVLGKELKIIESAVLVLVIYVAGQIIATPAKAVLEVFLVAKLLRRPNVVLFDEKKPKVRGLLFPGYYVVLPKQTRRKILAKAKSEGAEGTGEDLFLHVRYSPSVLNDEKLITRLNNFLNQYGFHRNLSFTALMVGTAFLIKIKVSSLSDADLMNYAIAALVAGALLFYRYLKFFRQYSYELFNTYARTN